MKLVIPKRNEWRNGCGKKQLYNLILRDMSGKQYLGKDVWDSFDICFEKNERFQKTATGTI